MSTPSELTIVIPAKNEAKLIPRLLRSLLLQDFPQISSTKIYLADANSTDGTPEIARTYADWLNIEVIPGGIPSVGRNAGARRATTPYVLFIDADMELTDTTLLRRSLELIKRRNLHCLTTNISCPTGSIWDRGCYAGNNLMQRLSRLSKPFSTGMFMMFNRECFVRLGGFHEQVLFAEDYLLSQKVARNRFAVVPGRIVTTNRRFVKMGHFKLVRLFLKTALNTWNEAYYLRDHKYWQSEA
jgi:glycosyltransferase involved in cell wall biosynthesis